MWETILIVGLQITACGLYAVTGYMWGVRKERQRSHKHILEAMGTTERAVKGWQDAIDLLNKVTGKKYN